MNSILLKLYSFFIPNKNNLTEELYRKARIFVNTLVITIIFSALYIINCIVLKITHIGIQIALFSVLFSILLFVFKKIGNVIVCGNIFSALFFLSSAYDIYESGGLNSPILPWLALVPMISILITDIKQSYYFLIACLVYIILIGIGQILGYKYPVDMELSLFSKLILTSSLGLVLIIFAVAAVMELAYIRSLNILESKNNIIEEEKKRSDELLLNILPEEVMRELKTTGKMSARNFDLVTVLFADFSDFTKITSEMPPEELVSTIHDYFREFDQITDKHGIEKIKTVGDAYICASGLPVPNMNNPIIMMDFALEMLDSIQKLKEEKKKEGKVFFEARIGIHSGPLVAGVVGTKKFAYDIWGDTVNTSARMQQHGDLGKINISGFTYNLIKHRFVCSKRDRVEVKNLGMQDMYYLERRK